MAFKIEIDHGKLSDSVLNDSNQGIFKFAAEDTRDFVEDIVMGNPTCYLISGYRGAGKSSFIKKLESEVRIAEINANRNEQRVFVSLNLAKHEQRSILLRKLIRNFYIQLTTRKENKTLKEKLERDKNGKKALEDFKDLFDQTFFEVSQHLHSKQTERHTSQIQFNSKELFLVISGVAFFILFSFRVDVNNFATYGPPLAALLVAAFPFMKHFGVDKKQEKEAEKMNHKTQSSFYDDEIAEYRLHKTILALSSFLKPVFVIDELDKIQDKVLVENIINELKPLMLSGDASFIIVAGQKLFYSYYHAQTKDDSPLSSLFSRVHHIKLKQTSELFTIFFESYSVTKSTDLGPVQRDALNEYINKSIFLARRVPRSFISLIRQKTIWEGGKPQLEIDEPLVGVDKYTKIMAYVDRYSQDILAGKSYPPAITDYINMKIILEIDAIIHERPVIENV